MVSMSLPTQPAESPPAMTAKETRLLSRYATAILAAKNDDALSPIVRKINRLSVSDECDLALRALVQDQRAWNDARARLCRTIRCDEPLPTRTAIDTYAAA